MKKTAILLAALLMSSTAAHANPYASASNRLEIGMTEQQVIQAIGVSQTSTELGTCGTNTPEGGWSCKTLQFGQGPYEVLNVLFERPNGSWVVNSWHLK